MIEVSADHRADSHGPGVSVRLVHCSLRGLQGQDETFFAHKSTLT